MQFPHEGRVLFDHLLCELLHLRVRRPLFGDASQSDFGLIAVNQAVRNLAFETVPHLLGTATPRVGRVVCRRIDGRLSGRSLTGGRLFGRCLTGRVSLGIALWARLLRCDLADTSPRGSYVNQGPGE